jgi:heme-degrading monooxygenase HmoA
MSVLIIHRMPPGFTTESYDQVNERADLEGDPPDGLITHTLATSADGAVIADVWESKEHFEAFRTGRLNPALEAVAGSEAFAQMPTPERDFYEVHHHTHG